MARHPGSREPSGICKSNWGRMLQIGPALSRPTKGFGRIMDEPISLTRATEAPRVLRSAGGIQLDTYRTNPALLAPLFSTNHPGKIIWQPGPSQLTLAGGDVHVWAFCLEAAPVLLA